MESLWEVISKETVNHDFHNDWVVNFAVILKKLNNKTTFISS